MSSQRFALKIYQWLHRLRMRLHRLFTAERLVYVTDRVDFYKQMWQSTAASLGARFSELTQGVWDVSRNGGHVRISGYKVPIDDPVTLDIAGDKALCYSLLKPYGIPMPSSRAFTLDDVEQGIRFFHQQQAPIVVKPAMGTAAGRGVTTHIGTHRQFMHAVALASLYSETIIAEQMLFGELYRLLFLQCRMIHAVRRTGIRLTGDGRSSIHELLQAFLTADGPHGDGRIAHFNRNDRDFLQTLAAQHLDAHTILPEGRSILAKSLPLRVSDRPETIPTYNENMAGKICSPIIQTASDAVRHLKIGFAGVDIVTLDASLPLTESGGGIIEINTTPGLHHHYHLQGSSHQSDPAREVLEFLLTKTHH